ncbi:hypothetical protein QZH41_013289 [Actinostola sp. cb2023]|nr:hypothetical protein QZH41_013289 [Actinostola sp. cb2023]
MGKKAKGGKQRKDKFYHLAKETGYRARSAFKLIQLNRKFNFLQSSRCLIDLCAAPGGWLQVASNFMPMSRLIVGVDLVPIKSIKNVITFQDDITSDSCKQRLKRELKTWKADCVLNDGAPNVGTAWVQDAFSQAELTLSALKLATQNLREGGWFITKVFRSKDYQPLLWVFQQLFKKVHSTKPQASRNESAEIFVVCEGYIAPHKIDPKMLDSKHVFMEVQQENVKKPTILNLEKKKRAEGYKEGDILFNTCKVSEFIATDSPLELLTDVNEIIFDDKSILNHALTTEEIQMCCKDIKVLGRPDIKNILAWQKSLRKELCPKDDKGPKKSESGAHIVTNASFADQEKIQNTILSLKEEEDAEVKRKKRKVQLQRQKLREKMRLKMVLPGDMKEIEEDAEIFSLANIKSKKHLEQIDDIGPNVMDDGAVGQQESDEEEIELDEQSGSDEDDDDEVMESSEDDEEEEEDRMVEEEKNVDKSQPLTNSTVVEKNPLVVDLVPDIPSKIKADMWFQKDAFKGLEDEQDEDLEISQMLEHYKKKGGKLPGESEAKAPSVDPNASTNDDNIKTTETPKKKTKLEEDNKKIKSGKETVTNDNEDTSSDESDSDAESDYDMEAEMVEEKQNKNAKDFEEIPQETSSSFAKKMTPEGLALGAQMAFSRKRKRDIIDDSFHRWSFNDESLPSWFTENESKHNQKQLPVTKEQVDEYRARLREINARPIKKIAEAKGRKKRKETRRMDRARKKAETICDASDVTAQEKLRQIQNLYKKAAGTKKKKELTYVVAKKHQAAKRMKRPSGVKGPYKVVDSRLKKDMRAKKQMEKKKSKKSGRGRKK